MERKRAFAERLQRLNAFFHPASESLRLDRLTSDFFKPLGVEVFLVRDDRLHPMIAGNKWWKLKHVLYHAAKQEVHTLKTYGGPYSNHVLAVAAAGHLFGFRTVGWIRGDEARPLNPVLSQAKTWGMQLKPTARDHYRALTQASAIHEDPVVQSGELILPEGGRGSLAMQGVKEMMERLKLSYDLCCCPVGTGCTLAGMVLGARAGSQVHGFVVLKGGQGLAEEVERSLTSHPPSGASWRLHHDYHFGGYARSTPALRSFTQAIAREGDFKPDVIYTGKMLYGLMDLIQRGIIAPSSRVVVWLTGNECTLPSSWNGRDDATSG